MKKRLGLLVGVVAWLVALVSVVACAGNNPALGNPSPGSSSSGQTNATSGAPSSTDGDAGEVTGISVTVGSEDDAGGGTWDALPAPPQVVNDDGGVLATPDIVAIFFSNEDATNLPTLEAVYNGIGSSAVWATGSEYGFGPATATIVVLDEAAPTTIDDTPDNAGDNTALQNWILSEISSNAIPAPGANTEYMINFPAGTTVTAGGTQCTDFDGYHSDLQNSAGENIAYGVIPHCTDMGSTYLTTFSSTVSHETMEAASDPYPDYSPAWAQADNAHLFFDEANTGSEIADMCENDPEAYYQFPGFPFTVQRIWSNKSALAGHDPCVPEIPGKIFFNAVPELPDTGPYDYYTQTVEVSSIHIPVGGTGTVFVDLYSDGAMDDWDVNVIDFNYFYSGDASQALLTFDQPQTVGNNGDRLPVTITVKAAGNPNTNGQLTNTELFVIYSSQGTSDTAPAHFWYGIVTN